MGEHETTKLGLLFGDYIEKRNDIVKRLNIINEDREAIKEYDISETGAFYAAVLDIEGDAITLLDKIKEFKRLHNREV